MPCITVSDCCGGCDHASEVTIASHKGSFHCITTKQINPKATETFSGNLHVVLQSFHGH